MPTRSPPTDTKDSADDRRQYFRIQDTASIKLQPIGPKDSAASCFQNSPQLTLLSELALVDLEGRQLLGQLNEHDRTLGAYLKNINRKFDVLSRLFIQTSMPLEASSVKEIDLSEGGVSFVWHEPFHSNQRIAVQLILLPEYVGLTLASRVKSCLKDKTPSQSSGFSLHLEFEETSENERHLIAKHVIRTQSRERQRRKLNADYP